MRNPIRVKNLRLRFAPLGLAAVALLILARPGSVEFATGAAIVLLGAGLRSWGAGHLVKSEALTTTGPYAHLRHPLYLGTLIVGMGVAVMAGGIWALVVSVAFLPWFFLRYFPRKEHAEAARLEALYGDRFRAYRRAVPALLPRLRAWPGAAAAGHWSLARYSDNNELGTLLGLLALLAVFGIRTLWVASTA